MTLTGDWNLQDWKMTDWKLANWNLADWKMTDRKMTDYTTIRFHITLPGIYSSNSLIIAIHSS